MVGWELLTIISSKLIPEIIDILRCIDSPWFFEIVNILFLNFLVVVFCCSFVLNVITITQYFGMSRVMDKSTHRKNAGSAFSRNKNLLCSNCSQIFYVRGKF